MMTLDITSGAIEAGRITHPTTRAVATGSTGDDAQVVFRYLGRTANEAALASGEIREQVCLKLRAADGCNVIYVCWRWAPGPPAIVVQAKVNPGMRESSECGSDGYKTLAGYRQPVGHPGIGEIYSLRAEIDIGHLEVRLGGSSVWAGDLPQYAIDMRGPAGLRTDNVELADVRLLARGVWR